MVSLGSLNPLDSFGNFFSIDWKIFLISAGIVVLHFTSKTFINKFIPGETIKDFVVFPLVNILLFTIYSYIIALIFCSLSGESTSFSDLWKPALVFIVYYGICIFTGIIKSFPLPPLSTVCSGINFILCNFIGLFLVSWLVWIRVLGATYSDCF